MRADAGVVDPIAGLALVATNFHGCVPLERNVYRPAPMWGGVVKSGEDSAKLTLL